MIIDNFHITKIENSLFPFKRTKLKLFLIKEDCILNITPVW